MTDNTFEEQKMTKKRIELLKKLTKVLNEINFECKIMLYGIYTASQTHLSREQAEKYWEDSKRLWLKGKEMCPEFFTDEQFNKCAFVFPVYPFEFKDNKIKIITFPLELTDKTFEEMFPSYAKECRKRFTKNDTDILKFLSDDRVLMMKTMLDKQKVRDAITNHITKKISMNYQSSAEAQIAQNAISKRMEYLLKELGL